MPINMWHRLSKDRKDIDIHSIKTVDNPSANQSGSGGDSANALPPPDPPALSEGLVVGASSLSPPGEGGGGGGGREGGGNPCTLIEKIWARRRHSVR